MAPAEVQVKQIQKNDFYFTATITHAEIIMEKKSNEQKNSGEKYLNPLQNSQSEMLTLFNQSERDSVNKALADFEEFTTKVITDGIEFLKDLEELSPTEMNLNNLHAKVAKMARKTLIAIKTNKVSTNEDMTRFERINDQLEEFRSSFDAQFRQQFGDQYQLIDYEKELLLNSLPKPDNRYNQVLPTSVERELLKPPESIESSVLVKFNILLKQYKTLIDYVEKSSLKKSIQKTIIAKISEQLAALNIFTSNPPTLEDKKKFNPPQEYKARIADPHIPKTDSILNALIAEFNTLQIYLTGVQLRFRKAVDNFPQRLSENPPDLSEAVEAQEKLEQNFQELSRYVDKENLNLDILLDTYAECLQDIEFEFNELKSLLSTHYKTVIKNYQETLGLPPDGSVLNLIKKCALLRELTEKIPHTGRKKHVEKLEAMIEELNLMLSENLLLDPSKQSGPKDSKISTNSNRFSFSNSSSDNSSSAITSISTVSTSTSTEITEKKFI